MGTDRRKCHTSAIVRPWTVLEVEVSPGQSGIQWLAVRVKPNFEITVHRSLETLDYETFLPMGPRLRQWSDRVKELQMPLFAGYLFCRSDSRKRIQILRTRPFPHFQVGEQVKIEDGPLRGLEGILQEIKNGYRIIVSITLLQRSVAAEVDSAWLRVVREVKRAS
jgi:hypothetical protein